jgi:hypothetical protein
MDDNVCPGPVDEAEALFEKLRRNPHQGWTSTPKKKVKPEHTLTYKILSAWFPSGYNEFGPGSLPWVPRKLCHLLSIMFSEEYREYVTAKRLRNVDGGI